METKMTLKKISRRDAIAYTLGVSALSASSSIYAQARTVKIGTVVPLSGPWASIGQNIKAGAEFAIDEINAAGGIKSLGGLKLELVAADAEDSVEKAKNAAQRLLAQEPNLVGGFGDALSGMTLVITELTEKAELPWLTQTFADVLTERGFKNIFEVVPVASTQGQLTLPTVVDLAKSVVGTGPKTAAVIADTNQAIQGMVKTWREGGFEKQGMTLLMEKSYTPPIADPTELVAGLRRNKPDVLFLMPSAIPDLKVLLDKLAEFGLGRDVLPTFAVAGPSGQPETLNVMGAKNLENFFSINSNWPGKKHQELAAKFKARSGRPWMTSQSLDGYGQIMIFKEALERAGAADRKKVAEAIRKMDTATGPADYFSGPLKWDEKGRRVGAGLVIAQWRGGQPVTVYPPALASTKPVWPGK
jgi:branched-chain amino acid transport system substrate-binding protein